MLGILLLLFNLLTLKLEYNINDESLKHSITDCDFKNYTVLVYIRMVKENKFQKDDII